jgi:hypothetical protein
MKRSLLTKKAMLIMIISQHGKCEGISSMYCQGGGINSQRYTRCPIKCAAQFPLPDKDEIYKIAVNKFVQLFGQEALIEVLM